MPNGDCWIRRVKVLGKVYNKDIIVKSGEVIERPKRRRKGPTWHPPITEEDIKDALDEECKVLVIGTGIFGFAPLDEECKKLLKDLKSKGIEVVIERTCEAIRKLEELVKKGIRVCAVIHVGC